MTHRHTRRTWSAALLSALLAASAGIPAFAADPWPARPIKFVVGYPAGGGMDGVARVFADALGARVKQSVIVENRPGASGTIGASFVAKAPADGYTIMIGSPAEMLVGEIAGQKQPYDAARDFSPVSMIADILAGIAVSTSVPIKNIAEFIEYARSGNELNYGSPGPGGPSHFAGESLNAIADINMLHIPYKGASPAITDLVGGQLQAAILGVPVILPFSNSDKVHLLAVTGKQRTALAPDVPAMAEMPGYSDFQFTNWVGAYLPKGASPDLTKKLQSELSAVARAPAIKEKLRVLGADVVGSSPEAFSQFLEEERARYQRVAESRNIKID